MKITKQLICPISNEHVNERVTRINALLTILIAVSGFVFAPVLFFAFLAADFYIRAFTNLPYSPISFLSHQMANTLNLGKKEVDKAPKIFAARVGFIFSLIITLLLMFQLNTAALIVAGILVFFATLEFALAICMGCILYTYFVLPFYK